MSMLRWLQRGLASMASDGRIGPPALLALGMAAACLSGCTVVVGTLPEGTPIVAATVGPGATPLSPAAAARRTGSSEPSTDTSPAAGADAATAASDVADTLVPATGVPTATGTEGATATPTVTDNPAATDTPAPPTETPLPTSTRLPTETPTPTATPTPAVTWRVASWHQLTPCENRGGHTLFINVVDAAGNGVANVPLLVLWEGGSQIIYTGEKLECGAGWAELPLYGAYTVQVNDGISEVTPWLSSHLPDSQRCDQTNDNVANSWGHYSYQVLFQRTY